MTYTEAIESIWRGSDGYYVGDEDGPHRSREDAKLHVEVVLCLKPSKRVGE